MPGGSSAEKRSKNNLFRMPGTVSCHISIICTSFIILHSLDMPSDF